MKIWIRLSDEILGLKLAKRLAEIAAGIETVVGPECGGGYDFVITDDDLVGIFPVSEALDRMEGEYLKRTGKRLQRANRGPKGLFLFTSYTGGSGLTAVSFTFARHMAGKLKGRVLYVEADSSGPLEYAEPGQGSCGSSRELTYLLKSGRDADIGAYLSKDRYGPEVISVRDPDRETLLEILEKSGHEYAVISGKRVPLSGNARIEVVNAMDKREPIPDPEADVRVFNRGTTVPLDEGSFVKDGKSVRIDMSGDFALAVGRLFREVMDEYGYGRTEKSGA